MTQTHYQLLGVPETASVEEIHLAYRAAARDAHPDSGGVGDRMQRLNRAWHILQDPGRRAIYDRELAAGRRQVTPGPATPAPEPAGGESDRGAAGRPGRRGDMQFDPSGYDPYDDLGDPYEDDDFVSVGFQAGDVPPVEGWWAMLPPAVLVLGLAMLGAALIFASPAFLVFAGGALFVALGLFVLVPMRAMLRGAHTDPPRSREE